MARGGARKGSGRKISDPSGEKRTQFRVYCTPTEKATLYSLLIQIRKKETK